MVLELTALALFLITLAGFSRAAWWCDIADFFRLQYIGISTLILCAALFHVDLVSATLSIISIALNTFRIRHFLPTFSPNSIYQNKDILSINAFDRNLNPETLKENIIGADPHVMLIMEMTENLERALSSALKPYPHRLQTPVRDGFSICLFSKTPLTKKNISHHGPGKTPLLHARAITKDTEFQIFCAHPKPALNKDWHAQRKIYLNEVAPIIAKSEHPTIVMGDFNAVPWEDDFKAFLRTTNLKSTLDNAGYQITWPVFMPLLGIPMDHILLSKNIDYHDVHVGPYSGSDHYPISINLGPSGT